MRLNILNRNLHYQGSSGGHIRGNGNGDSGGF